VLVDLIVEVESSGMPWSEKKVMKILIMKVMLVFDVRK
jgi:hypothetical protein